MANRPVAHFAETEQLRDFMMTACRQTAMGTGVVNLTFGLLLKYSQEIAKGSGEGSLRLKHHRRRQRCNLVVRRKPLEFFTDRRKEES